MLQKQLDKINRLDFRKMTRLSGLLFTAAIYLYDLRYLLLHGSRYLDSDVAAEMLLADKLNQSGSILAADWYYSTEIRVFGMQNFFRLGLVFFPSNWALARVFGEGLALLVLALGVFLLARKLSLEGLEYWAPGFALCPLGFWYFWQTIYGGYYLPYALRSIYTLFLILALMEPGTKTRKLLRSLGLGAIALVSGMQGVRQLMVLYAPLLLALVFARNKKQLALPVVGSTMISAVGYFINAKILAKHYYYVKFDEMVWGKGSGSWLKSLKWYFEGFGYAQNRSMAYEPDASLEVRLFSGSGIGVGMGLMLGFAVFGAIIYLLLNLKRLNDAEHFLTLTGVSMLFVIGLVFTYLSGSAQYWQQTMVFGLLLLLIAVKNFSWEELHFTLPPHLLRLAAAGMLAVCALVSGKATADATLVYPLRAELGLDSVTDWILENTSYRKGVAEFWLSDVVTEWSNGEMEMYTVYDATNPTKESFRSWLQSVSHRESFPEEDFVVICPYAGDAYAGTCLTDDLQAECIYNDGKYMVFAVD